MHDCELLIVDDKRLSVSIRIVRFIKVPISLLAHLLGRVIDHSNRGNLRLNKCEVVASWTKRMKC